MDTRQMIGDLTKALGKDDVLFARRDLLVYAYDAEEVRRPPDAIAFPADAAETALVVRTAALAGRPVIARGAGTNLSGGTLAIDGGVIVETSRMARPPVVDLPNRRVVAQPGIINLELQNLLAPSGYFYGPDPASQKVSTLGGNVGENAGGPHCFKYGVTSNHVLGVELVLADGSVVEVGGLLEDNQGYDLTGLLVGSEGTLGIATKLTLKVLRSPESIRTLLVIFDSLDDAGEAVAAIVAAGMIPATLELMDQQVVRAIEAKQSYGFPLDAAGVLLIEVDGLQDELDRQASEISELCYSHHAREVRFAHSVAERDALWAGRRGAFGAIASIAPAYIVQDGTVPRTSLAKMLGRVVELCDARGVRVANLAHAGDGNLHPLFMFDPKIPGDFERVQKVAAEILAECVARGGTLTGEHGIGVAKQQSMPVQFGAAELDLLGRVKRTFDPEGRMNPGKIFPGELPTPAPAGPIVRDVGALAERLSVGNAGHVVAAEDLGRYRVGAIHPVAAVRPASEAEAIEVVRAATAAGVPIVPWGRGTHQAVGRQRATEALVLDLGDLTGVHELDPGNQTVRVGAGTTLAELDGAVRPSSLRFPLDPEEMAEMTVGGLVAVAATGPNRLGFGLPRDLVLGLRAITPWGELVRIGGKTMKDVAGYDLRKLFIGSWGTLGAVVEATLRLYPLPEAASTLVARFPDAAKAGEALSALLASPLQPVALELLSADPLADGGGTSPAFTLLARLEGRREAVARLERDAAALLAASGQASTSVVSGEVEASVWDARYSALRPAREGAALQVKWSVPISRVADLFGALAGVSGIGETVAHAGSGVGRSLIPLKAGEVVAVESFLAIRRQAQTAGGFAYLERAPLAVLESHGDLPPRGDYRLMARLREAIDPLKLFSPGRAFAPALAEVR